jgi:hypothetical protein
MYACKSKCTTGVNSEQVMGWGLLSMSMITKVAFTDVNSRST